MANVITLTGYRPLPRYDDVKWNRARLEEGTGVTGPWTPIETFTVADYPDPEDPPSLNFTSDEAVSLDDWFRVVWLDASDNTSTSDAVRGGGSGGVPPSVSELRSLSEFIRVRYPASPYSGQVETDLINARAAAIGIIESLTCRTLDSAVPAALIEVARRVVVAKTEQLLQAFTLRSRRGAFNLRVLKGFSAGPYSETYFTPDEAAKMQRLDPDPLIHELLWALATEECREKWIALWTGEFAPATGVMEVAWEMRGFRGY